MTFRTILLLTLAFCFIQCESQTYQPKNLRKLSPEEIIERIEKGIAPNPKLVIKNEQGVIISPDSIQRMPDLQLYTTDIYVNQDGLDVEAILRKATEEDLEWREKMENAMMKPEEMIELVDINCDSLSFILPKIQELDQGIRNGKVPYDPEIDKQNVAQVVSILETCDSSILVNLDFSNRSTLWLVIQHGPSLYQKQYISLFKDWAAKNKLSRTKVAMMEDRILLDEGKPQIYGTQVIKDKETGAWKLYDLADPHTVDQRRAELGWGPLSEYLKNFEVTFNVEQKEE